MATGGKADDAKPVRIEVPGSGIQPGQPDGALGVWEWQRGISVWQAVFEDDTGDVVLIPPGGDSSAFVNIRFTSLTDRMKWQILCA